MKLEEIEKLCNAASPGPWEYVYSIFAGYSILAGEGGRIATMDSVVAYRDNTKINGEFIVASRELIPKLLAVAKAAKDVSKFGEFNKGCDGCWISNLDLALEELEKE